VHLKVTVGSGPEAETLQKGLHLLLKITAAGLRFRARSWPAVPTYVGIAGKQSPIAGRSNQQAAPNNK
jgi:hypothetical protein